MINEDIYLFYHVALFGSTKVCKDITEEQISYLMNSGLIKKAKYLFVGILYENTIYLNEFKKLLTKYELSNIKIIYESNNIKEYEFPTIQYLKDFCNRTPGNFFVFYFHTKGMSHNDRTTASHRKYMQHFLIERYEEFSPLFLVDKEIDAVGLNYRFSIATQTPPHFSGNFWWARSSYIRKLPDFLNRNIRWDAEFNIARIDSKFLELYSKVIKKIHNWSEWHNKDLRPKIINNNGLLYKTMLMRKY